MPTNLLCAVLIVGFFLRNSRFRKAARRMIAGAFAVLVMSAWSPLGNILLLPLEQRFSQPHDKVLPKAPYGIIVLGGSVDTIISKGRGTVSLNGSAERVAETVKLARRFPASRILFSGGSGEIIYQSMSESDIMERWFAQMGISPDRLSFERKSRNTWQNAIFTKKHLGRQSRNQWLLITSAYHMPRAVGCFRKAGVNVIPWPVDYRTRGWQDVVRFFDVANKGWKQVDIAVREWIGLIVYRLSGRTTAFFPSAGQEASRKPRDRQIIR